MRISSGKPSKLIVIANCGQLSISPNQMQKMDGDEDEVIPIYYRINDLITCIVIDESPNYQKWKS